MGVIGGVGNYRLSFLATFRRTPTVLKEVALTSVLIESSFVEHQYSFLFGSFLVFRSRIFVMCVESPVIVVVFPSPGTGLAAAALSRMFSTSPEVVLAEEVGELQIVPGRRMIVLEYLVAVLNYSPIPQVLTTAKDCVAKQAEVVGFREYSAASPADRTGLDSLLFAAMQPQRELRGYEAALASIRCNDRPLDEVSRQLAEQATAIDMRGENFDDGILAAQSLPPFGHSPGEFRRFVSAAVEAGNALLVS